VSGNRTPTRKPFVFNLIESQVTLALGPLRVHTKINPLTVEVQEIPSFGCFSSTLLTITTFVVIFPFEWNDALQQRQPELVLQYL
jgi:hypothetical protein